MGQDVYCITAEELATLGPKSIPEELQSGKHLIYSSPATLAFNSPGAQGFGVKRAGLAVPGSVMLLVAPGCCGRNTMIGAGEMNLRDRFFFLLQDDTDIVTGRHLSKISQAVKEVVASLEKKPSVVMICITCVDALLGTDMERVCRKATEEAGVPVLPCYMYALTREGRTPPMTAVRKTVYELLEPRKRKKDVVNLLGEFAPYDDDTELYDVLRALGVKKINELSRCVDFEEYLTMAEANFNLVLNNESRLAADDFKKRLGIPSIEITRQYQMDKIQKQYELLGASLGVRLKVEEYHNEACEVVESFTRKHGSVRMVIGEWMNGDAFELALAMLRYGHKVPEIYGTVGNGNFVYVKKIAALSPKTKIYTNLSPSMLNYSCSSEQAELTIGKDAAFYHPNVPNVSWNSENKPFGYKGLIKLFQQMDVALMGKEMN